MSSLSKHLDALTVEQIQGISRGIEKESLRTTPLGALAHTPHPQRLGSALTNPHITTDFSESQVELVTGVHRQVDACLNELQQIHQFVYQSIGQELLWSCSMPSALPADDDIPVGHYGRANIGQAKRIYRMGLSHRYGRRMQTISGIHYNWSMPGLSNDQYFALIRNFRRQSFLLLVLFGASPAVATDFVTEEARHRHGLQAWGRDTLYLPHATSLRMGRLGYQSDAQSALAVSYNCLEGYASSLHQALTQSYAPYESIGVQGPDGEYRQLSTSLLQIENEFYSSIRPKRVIQTGERPLHALRARGVEYVEVRCMDLNPFLPMGIDGPTVRLLDTFLLHCLMSDSPPDTPDEIAALSRNQQLVATRGREPGLMLERQGQTTSLQDWATDILRECLPIAARLDSVNDSQSHSEAVANALDVLRDPGRLPSARVLGAFESSDQPLGFLDFGLARSEANRALITSSDLPARALHRFEREAAASLAEQAVMEARDATTFEAFRQHYVCADRLAP